MPRTRLTKDLLFFEEVYRQHHDALDDVTEREWTTRNGVEITYRELIVRSLFRLVMGSLATERNINAQRVGLLTWTKMPLRSLIDFEELVPLVLSYPGFTDVINRIIKKFHELKKLSDDGTEEQQLAEEAMTLRRRMVMQTERFQQQILGVNYHVANFYREGDMHYILECAPERAASQVRASFQLEPELHLLHGYYEGVLIDPQNERYNASHPGRARTIPDEFERQLLVASRLRKLHLLRADDE